MATERNVAATSDIIPMGEHISEGEGRYNLEAGKRARRGRSKTRDPLGSIERRLTRVELAVADSVDKLDGWDQRIEELGSSHEELRGEMQGALNVVIDDWSKRLGEVKDLLLSEIKGIKDEIKEIKAELSLCKMATVHGSSVAIPALKLEVPRPKCFNGSRNAKELDNFLWGLEQYFDARGIKEDDAKVRAAPLFLEDIAMLWWRRKHVDVQRGTCTIASWDDFRREIKKQFYPENVEHEARARLRRLTQQGTIREYVKEFSELLLEIPDMPDKEAFFAFTDGLQSWAKIELQRRGVRDLASAIATAESLVELRKSEGWTRPEQPRDEEGNGGRDNTQGERQESSKSPSRGKGRGKRRGDKVAKEKPTVECFLCNGRHRTRDCPKRDKLSALIYGEEAEEEFTRIGTLRLLDAIDEE